ncbi:MAG: MFS transporter [Actinomycetota bacterium]
MTQDGWRPLRGPDPERRGAEAFVVSPFMRLARVHAFGAASDAAIAVTLASSIFFSISPDDSRARVALYLALTMAPFAIVAPLLGPAIDRAKGGRRWMILGTAAGRAVMAFLMISNIDSLWLFPLAFSLLVLQKAYSVAKSAVVPALVRSETDLVSANSRLALISAVSGMVGASISGIFSLIGGPSFAAAIAMVGFVTTTVLATQVPRTVVAAEPAEESEREELRDTQIVLAAYATAILRGIVGFVTFLLAFEFRGGKEGLDISTVGSAAGGMTATDRGIDITGDPAAPAWHFGVVLLVAGIGALLGARIAPSLRERTAEERMLQSSLAAVGLAALFAAFSFDLFGAAVLSFFIAAGAATGKLAFDSLVQREAPDANYGRSFARFEARFQGAWVIGAFVPAVIPLNLAVGGVAVAAAAIFALVSYLIGKPAHSAVSFSSVRSPRLGRNGASAATDSAATPVSAADPDPVATPPEIAEAGGTPGPAAPDDPDELTLEDLRPSQPEAPAGTSDYALGWGVSEPIISSVDGVEVDPPNAPSTRRPDESTDDAAT